MHNTQKLAAQLADIQQQLCFLERQKQTLHAELHVENTRRQRMIREDMTAHLVSYQPSELHAERRSVRPGDPVDTTGHGRILHDTWGAEDFDVIERLDLFNPS